MGGGDAVGKWKRRSCKAAWHHVGAQGGQQAGLHSLPLVGGWLGLRQAQLLDFRLQVVQNTLVRGKLSWWLHQGEAVVQRHISLQ